MISVARDGVREIIVLSNSMVKTLVTRTNSVERMYRPEMFGLND